MTTDAVGSGKRLIEKVAVLVASLSMGVVLTCATAGCGDELPSGYSRKVIALDDVPEPIMKTARKAIPGVNFQDAWSNLDKEGKTHSYEIRGRASSGKIREVRVSPQGEVLEME